jgi:two-component system alkaline phosphatase synthesis response regulator PhoP
MSGTKKILIVDDEPDAIEFVEAVLSELVGLTTISANNGMMGLDMARDYKPDLIILDIQMPGMNGFQVFKELKKETITRNIPIIMLTGIATTTGLKYDAKDMGITLGAEPNAYIDKPVNPTILQKTVSKILEL